jgi:hypothetical protein
MTFTTYRKCESVSVRSIPHEILFSTRLITSTLTHSPFTLLNLSSPILFPLLGYPLPPLHLVCVSETFRSSSYTVYVFPLPLVLSVKINKINQDNLHNHLPNQRSRSMLNEIDMLQNGMMNTRKSIISNKTWTLSHHGYLPHPSTTGTPVAPLLRQKELTVCAYKGE